MNFPEFHAWGKTARVDSPVVVTEKIDGTNGLIVIGDQGEIFAGSRNHWLVGQAINEEPIWNVGDNYGFGAWAVENHHALIDLLGQGWHYGEWWGQGIARRYDQTRKRFALFDIRHSDKPWGGVWDDDANEIGMLTVPVLYDGPMDHKEIERTVEHLQKRGSVVAPGYRHPEGLVVRFSHNGVRFKKVIDKVGPQVQRVFKDKPAKRQWTQEEIDAARAAAEARKSAQRTADEFGPLLTRLEES